MPQALPVIQGIGTVAGTIGAVRGLTGGGSAGRQTTTTQLDPQTQAAQQQLFSAAQQAAQQPFTPYTGPMVAGFSPDQLQAFQAARGLFGETQAFSPISQLQQLAQTPLDVSAYMSPYQEAVIDPALRGIQERQEIAQQASQEAAIKAGAFGGSRGTILESEAQKPYIQAAADTEARLRERGFQQGLQTALQQQGFQADLLGDLYGQQLKGIGLLTGLGGQQQALQQQALGAARGEFERALAYPAQQLGLLATGVSGITPSGTTVSGYSPSALERLMGGMQAYQTLQPMFSNLFSTPQQNLGLLT
jgi:hypothetical protein